tara:strand:+ start:4103 stop:4438 length:336 start_codon:yes stop_codon:yes gene_type:complete
MNKRIAKNNERGKHPNSLKAIEPHQFKKGESGNVGGRPKKYYNLSKSLEKIRDKVITIQKSSVDIMLEEDRTYVDIELGTNKDLVVSKIWELARGGNEKMILLLAELGLLD